MPRVKSYIIELPPVAWQRAKLNGQRFFDGQHKDKVCFGLHMNSQHKGEPLFSTAIDIQLTFYMPQPKSMKKLIPHSNAPDLDNLCKFILDAMKGVLITDDKIISTISAKKVYDHFPRYEFTITELT